MYYNMYDVFFHVYFCIFTIQSIFFVLNLRCIGLRMHAKG
jgi:hypothetical protein